MMNHAELDFGIFRIMNQKRSDIQDFLISNTDYKEVSLGQRIFPVGMMVKSACSYHAY